MTTALEQQREDALLGSAWRRCEAALPEGWSFRGVSPLVNDWRAFAMGPQPSDGPCPCCGQNRHDRWPMTDGRGPTPTAALTALAEALEARQQQADGSYSWTGENRVEE